MADVRKQLQQPQQQRGKIPFDTKSHTLVIDTRYLEKIVLMSGTLGFGFKISTEEGKLFPEIEDINSYSTPTTTYANLLGKHSVILSINGTCTLGLSHEEVVDLVPKNDVGEMMELILYKPRLHQEE
jgi:hypothetical protein